MSGVRGTLLITRPREDARTLQALLRAKGFKTRSEPLLAIEACADKATLAKALACRPQAIMVTSKYAVRQLALLTAVRTLPLIAVGKATAQFARAQGFTRVVDAGGTAEKISSYIQSHCDPANGPLLYARGHDVSVDIAAELARKGFKVESIILYQATPAQHFSSALIKALSTGKITGALFFSERTAATYAALAAPLSEVHSAMHAYCLSEKIAGPLRALSWKKIHIAEQPDVEHLLRLLP